MLFDCDGVLVDSERITNTTLRTMLGKLGWRLSPEECMERFVGHTLREEADVIETHTGFRITEDWLAEFRARRNHGLRQGLLPVAGAVAAVAAVHTAYEGRIACVSAADRIKIELQLNKVGLFEAFSGRIFSGLEVPRSKPAPDVYLAAARSLGVDPTEVAVVEDSLPGVEAGHRAGARVYGFCPGGASHRRPEELIAAGAEETFTSMDQLPSLLTEQGR